MSYNLPCERKYRRKGCYFHFASMLVITVWVLSILSILTVSVSYLAKTQISYSSHLQDRVKLYYFAKAGIEKAMVGLANKEDLGYTAFFTPMLNDKELFKNVSLGEGYFTLSYPAGQTIAGEEATLYGVMDESSNIDINNLPVDMLAGMFERAAGLDKEQSTELAQAVDDWRSKSGDLQIREYYQELELPYESKGADFEKLEELLLVKGMTQEIFLEIKDIITVYGTEKVNINTAGLGTFYALGLSERLSGRIAEYRRGHDGIAGTEDDNIFETVNNLRDIGFLFTEDSLQINRLISDDLIKTQSETFRIKSTGHFEEGQDGENYDTGSRGITCIVKLQEESRPEIVYWHED